MALPAGKVFIIFVLPDFALGSSSAALVQGSGASISY
jgi:hypothetical protein